MKSHGTLIPIYKQYLPNVSCVLDAINSTWISSSMGKYKDLAIEELRRITGCKYVILTSSGTTAMHLVAKSLRYKHPDINTLVIPDNVYVAAINPFLYDGEYWNLKLSNTDESTWNMVDEIPEERCAVLIVHNIGNVINVPELKRKHPSAVFVEDNCEGFLGEYEGKPTDSESLCSAISFYGNKTLSSGEGGAFVTNDKDIFEYAYRLHSQGETEKRFVYDMLGYNYRMTNVAAAILCGQIESIDNILEMKGRIFDRYRSELGHLSQEIDPNTKNANWMFGVRIKGSSYETTKKYFEKHHIETRPMFYPLMTHTHLPIRECGEAAKILSKECVLLPSYPELLTEDVKHIIRTVKEYKATIS